MVICDFSDPSAELQEKEIKRQTLQELLEYVGSHIGILTSEAPYPEIVKMVNTKKKGGRDITLIYFFFSLLLIYFVLFLLK